MHACQILIFAIVGLICGFSNGHASAQSPTPAQLERWLKRFPKADANGDGKLSATEAKAFRDRARAGKRSNSGNLIERKIADASSVDPGWEKDHFPEHAVCYMSPDEIAELLAQHGKQIVSYAKPDDGSLRIVGTGHSFMAPGYKTFPKIAKAAGFKQPPLLTHTGGGMTGSARYKWEQENGIFGFDKKPLPILLASIANAEWDVMMWGPYFQDRPKYYACWIEFCLKYNPQMKFYLSDAWPQIDQFGNPLPRSEDELTDQAFIEFGKQKRATYVELIGELNQRYPDRVYVLPTCDAMVLAVQSYHRGELPGIEGIHQVVGGKERSLWRDRLGHLGPGLERLEGYVFYATIYGRSPELIERKIQFGGSKKFPNEELDRAFRKIAWEAVINNPLSGVVDKNGNGIGDDRE